MRPHDESAQRASGRLGTIMGTLALIAATSVFGACGRLPASPLRFEKPRCLALSSGSGLIKVWVPGAPAGTDNKSKSRCLLLSSQLGSLACTSVTCTRVSALHGRSEVIVPLTSQPMTLHLAYGPQEPGAEVLLAQVYQVPSSEPCSKLSVAELGDSGSTTFSVR